MVNLLTQQPRLNIMGILMCLFLSQLIGCSAMFSKNRTKFNWLATESAPKYFTMRVLSGNLHYHKAEGGLYIPEAASIGRYWGTGESTHVVGDTYKPLPDRLTIQFFSFWENTLYQGDFELPYEHILAQFKAGVAATEKGRATYNRIMVGIAPGGAVAVWLSGRETREVFFGQAQPYEADIENAIGSPITNRAEYAQSYLDKLPSEFVQNIKKNGIPFGIWNEYRKHYTWAVDIQKAGTPKDIGYGFFNGESYRLEYPIEQQLVEQKMPIPALIKFWATELVTGERHLYIVHFNYNELREKFDQLSNTGKVIRFEFTPKFPKRNTLIRLTNGDESIDLKHFNVEEW